MKRYLIVVLLFSCKDVKFNHPAEGAGGVIVGIKQRIEKTNSVLVSNFPAAIEEGASASIQIKLSQAIDVDTTVTITPENQLLQINDLATIDLTFTAENYNIDQSVTLTLLPSDKVVPIDIGINFQTKKFPNTRLVLTGNYKFSRKLSITGPASLQEETPGILKVKLLKKPEGNATVIFTSNASSSIAITPTTLVFTPDNYSTEQNISISMNDIYNDNRSYTITGTSDSESTSYSLSIIDNDYSIIDISTTTGMSEKSGKQPSITVDPANNRFFVVTRNASANGGAKPLIYRCDNLNGTNCNHFWNATKNLSPNSGYNPHISYDSINQNLYIMTFDLSSTISRAMSIDANMTGSIDCSTNTYSCNQVFLRNGTNIFSLLATPGKILFILVNAKDMYINECDRANISNCAGEVFATYSSSSLGTVGARGVKYDPITEQVFGFMTGDSIINSNFYSFIPKSIIATNRGNFSSVNDCYNGGQISKMNFGYTPDLAIDNINNRLIISTFDYSAQGGGAGRPGLIFCDKTIANCNFKELPGNFYPSYHPKLLWDSINKKILIITYNASKKPYLHHCDENGNNCSETDLSRGQSYSITEPEGSGYNFDAAIDTVNNRVLLVFSDGTTGKLILLRYGLGGF